MKIDYSTGLLYVMYIVLVVLSALGGYFRIYTADIAQYVLLFVLGHFAGVMTPSPIGGTSNGGSKNSTD